ncbi:MAG: family 43 glycosylhydrolase [Lachnospiraceae bacterium]|nr:family 43 glycosylhydrolase [Lachnospiraceae bacterium]
MMKRILNPILPSWEYVADGEPHVFGDRVYLFGSHDAFNGRSFCPLDYVLWSAPLRDLSDWRKEGVIYRTQQDPQAKRNSFMQAPDVIRGTDGRFYLYYTLSLDPTMSVAVSDTITGPYEYYGRVKDITGHVIGSSRGDLFQFDPGLFRDDDGRIYLYSGFGPNYSGILGYIVSRYQMHGGYVMELGEDMLTVTSGPNLVLPRQGEAQTGSFAGHEFYEASSMRKIGGKYYWIYSSVLSHELCYAVSDHPDRDFRFGGTIISIGNVGWHGQQKADNYTGNTHGSLVCIEGQWYIFYHRQTNGNMFSRQACAEPVQIRPDGTICQVQTTSCGLAGTVMDAEGEFPAGCACTLQSPEGTLMYTRHRARALKKHPYITQSGKDREENPDQYIANMSDGCSAGFRYLKMKGPGRIAVQLNSGKKAEGTMRVSAVQRDGTGERELAVIPVCAGKERRWFETRLAEEDGDMELRFTWNGSGTVSFYTFRISGESVVDNGKGEGYEK